MELNMREEIARDARRMMGKYPNYVTMKIMEDEGIHNPSEVLRRMIELAAEDVLREAIKKAKERD